MIDTVSYERSTIQVTTKLPDGQVVIFSSTRYVKRVVTKLTRENCPERLAVELLREGEMCYS
jgi:hypothetical protein